MEQMLEQLAHIIIKNIKEEFAIKHLSKNLMNTLKVESGGENIVKVHIPAEIYDIAEYKSKKIIKYTGKGSYASDLDKKSKNHTGYIDKVINKSIQEWLVITGNTAKAKVEG